MIVVHSWWHWQKILERGSTIHSVTYADDAISVSVEKVIDGDAEVPYRTSKIQYLGQAIDTFIAWPTQLVKVVSHEVMFICHLILFH